MIDMTKKYRTRDGRDVRILCVDGFRDAQPVVGIIARERYVTYWTTEGRFWPGEPDNQLDLIEVAPDVVTYHYVSRDGIPSPPCWTLSVLREHHSREDRIAIARTTVRNGSDVSVDVLPVDYKETP